MRIPATAHLDYGNSVALLRQAQRGNTAPETGADHDEIKVEFLAGPHGAFFMVAECVLSCRVTRGSMEIRFLRIINRILFQPVLVAYPVDFLLGTVANTHQHAPAFPKESHAEPECTAQNSIPQRFR